MFHALKRSCIDLGLSTAVGDEGGFAPDTEVALTHALEFIVAG